MTKKILIVDDEPDIITTVSMLLRADDYAVITATNGQDAIVKINDEKPDLIILDVVLPKVKGTEVAALLRNDAKYKHLPIILITAQAQKSQEQALEETLANFCMIKPFDFDELKNKVDELLNINHNRIKNHRR